MHLKRTKNKQIFKKKSYYRLLYIILGGEGKGYVDLHMHGVPNYLIIITLSFHCHFVGPTLLYTCPNVVVLGFDLDFTSTHCQPSDHAGSVCKEKDGLSPITVTCLFISFT